MDVETKAKERLIKTLDRLVHPRLDETDVTATAFAVRRLTNGVALSVIFHLTADGAASTNALVASLRDKIKKAKEEKAELIDELNTLRLEKIRLEQRLIGLESGKQVHRQPPPRPQAADADTEKAFYSYDEVAAIMRKRLGKHNGGLRMWQDYSAAQRATHPNSDVVTGGKLNTWRKTNAYPAWAVEQLRAMPIEEPTRHQWSDEDIAFLRDLHLADPRKSDEQLARECSKRFGCHIGINSIKGKFNLLRKRGEIPPYRPT